MMKVVVLLTVPDASHLYVEEQNQEMCMSE